MRWQGQKVELDGPSQARALGIGMVFQHFSLFENLTVAENVAYGCKESACVIQQWVNSSGHRKNMLIPGLTRYGLASAVSPSGKKYWTLLVGE